MTTLVQQQEPHHRVDASDYHSRATMQQPERAKNIVVYKNGDKYYPGRKFVVNRRCIPDFNGFLNMVTVGLKPSFGAVRNVYTPINGHKVSDLGDLNNGMSIVAAGVERFRKLQYNEITTQPKRGPGPRFDYFSVKPVHHAKMNVPARWRYPSTSPCTIFVYQNGDENGAAVRVLLIPRIMKGWQNILQEITEKISLPTAVRKLYTTEGKQILGPEELETSHYYVAAGNERFKRIDYGHRAKQNAMLHSPRRPVALPPLKGRARTLNSKLSDGNQQSYAEKYAHKRQLEEQRYQHPVPPGPERQRRLKPLKTSTAPPLSSESDSVFHAKPVKVKRSGASGRLTQVSAAEDDVFRAKGDEMRAEEVDDDDDVKVDLPIDQMPADTVEDEDIKEVPAAQEDIDDPIPEQRRTPSPSPSPVIAAEPEDREAEKTPSSPSRAAPQPSARSEESNEGDQQSNGSAIQPEQREEPAENLAQKAPESKKQQANVRTRPNAARKPPS